MSGKSIEIINTDAEGRLVLADGAALRALARLHPPGRCGDADRRGRGRARQVYAGIFANDDAMSTASGVLEAAGEKMWPMPLDDDYMDQIRGTVADLLNTGGRYGGAITAAMFLKEFAEDTPWIHLDIAGTAWTEEQKPWIAKGPSGIALRSLVEFARDFADSKG